MKMNMIKAFAIASLAMCMSGCIGFNEKDKTVVTGLKTSFLESPLNIDETPTFSWRIESVENAVSQSSYRIRVYEGSKDGAVVWDSNEVSSGISVGIPYGGAKLKSATKYAWDVTVKNQKGETPFKKGENV